jgi:ribose 5-phosphate isomerase A
MTTLGEQKRRLGIEVSRHIHDGQLLGLGAGSTVACVITAIGDRIQREKLSVSAIVSSYETELACAIAGIRVVTGLNTRPKWGFDGADEVAPNLDVLKGSGGKMLREKIVASTVERLVILVDESKMVARLGTRFPIPVEVIPEAREPVSRELKRLGAVDVTVRASADTCLVISERGNLILDSRFSPVTPGLGLQIKGIPGVVETGLFEQMCHQVWVAEHDGVWSLEKRGTEVVKSQLSRSAAAR